MSTQTVEYVTCSELCCGALPAPVIICIPREIAAAHACPVSGTDSCHYTYIEAEIQFCCPFNSGCNPSFKYTLTYDSAQLIEGAVVSGQDITGIFCKGCVTAWIEEKIGNEPFIRTNEDSTQTFVSPHGCEYPIHDVDLVLTVEDTPSVDLTLASGVLSADSKISADSGNAISVHSDGLFAEGGASSDCTVVVGDATYAEFVTALAGAPTAGIVLCGSVTLTADLAINVPIKIQKGGQIVTSGHTLTINSLLYAGPYQIFVAADNEVVLLANSVSAIYVEWWGAKGDGVTDDYAAIQSAIDCASLFDPSNLEEALNIATIVLLNRVYAIGSQLRLTGYLRITGTGTVGLGGGFSSPDLSTATIKAIGTDHGSLIYINFWDYVYIENINFNQGGFLQQLSSIQVAGGSTNIFIKGCGFYSNNQGPTIIDFSSNIELDACSHIFISNCVFASTTTSGGAANVMTNGIRILGTTQQISIFDNEFGGTYRYPIHIKLSDFGDTFTNRISIANNYISAALASSFIYFEDAGGESSQRHMGATIIGNQFSGNFDNLFGSAWAFVRIDQHYSDIFIASNTTLDGNTNIKGVLCGGQFVTVESNYFNANLANAVEFTSSSANCYVGLNDFSTLAAANQVSDSGTGNFRLRRTDQGITANRPYRGPKEFGATYLDTTLNAGGQLIIWNGTSWRKSDGTAA